jgi:hypothetical protein
MPKIKTPRVPREPRTAPVVKKEVDYSFKLGDRVFPVIAFSESEDSYNKATEFLVLASPIIMKILGMASSSNSPLASIDPGQAISGMDFPSLIRETSLNLPEIVALSCQMSDESVTGEDVRKLAKVPLNSGMIRAIVLQMKKDNIIGQFAQIQAELSELTAELGSLVG